MRRPAPLVAGLAILAIAAGTTVGAEEPRGSEFINPDDVRASEFSIPSSKKFDVEGDLETRVVQVLREENKASTDPLTRQGLDAIWAKKCPAQKQELTFRRKVFLPGPEYKLGAGVQLFRGNAIIKSAELAVNGHRLLDVTGSGGSIERSEKRAKVFTFGMNRIELTVVRKPTFNDKPCNTSTAPGKYTGVAFHIYGEFAGDVELPPQVAHEYRRLKEGEFGVGVPLEFSFRNKGPGGLPRAPLSVYISVPNTFDGGGYLFEMDSPESPMRACTASPPPGTFRKEATTVVCSAANLRAGDIARQRMRVAFFMPSGQSRGQVFVRWSSFVEEPTNANHTDNERYKTIWLCKYDDTGPECPPP